MSVPPSQYPIAIVAPPNRFPVADDDGMASNTLQQWQTKMHAFINCTTRILPCDVSGTNDVTLTQFQPAPYVGQYSDYDAYRFFATNTSTGAMTATIARAPPGPVLPVFVDGGSTAAGAGDMVSGRLYDMIYVDALNSGAGGFVLSQL